MQHFFGKKKAAKKEDKKMAKALMYTPDDVKERIVVLYSARMNLMHLVKFL